MSRSSITRVVLTGGPGSGKSDLIEMIKGLEYAIVDEAAIEFIEELIREKGEEETKKWRRQNVADFQALLAPRAAKAENEAVPGKEGFVFLDRAVPDGIAFCRKNNVAVPNELAQLVHPENYNIVFVCDTLTVFPERPDSGRLSNQEDSRILGELLEDVYRGFGLPVHRVANGPIEDRLFFICRTLGIRIS
jgi:predicted ATPase